MVTDVLLLLGVRSTVEISRLSVPPRSARGDHAGTSTVRDTRERLVTAVGPVSNRHSPPCLNHEDDSTSTCRHAGTGPCRPCRHANEDLAGERMQRENRCGTRARCACTVAILSGPCRRATARSGRRTRSRNAIAFGRRGGDPGDEATSGVGVRSAEMPKADVKKLRAIGRARVERGCVTRCCVTERGVAPPSEGRSVVEHAGCARDGARVKNS